MCSTSPANSWHWISGVLMRAAAHASQSKMWTSVPQIEAIFTRMRTSSGVGSGTGTFWTSVLFGADLSFTAAFIVETMPTPQHGRWGAEGLAVFQPCIRSQDDRGARFSEIFCAGKYGTQGWPVTLGRPSFPL